jgi:glycerol-3-phosphate cytidylyltransferase-like family protein
MSGMTVLTRPESARARARVASGALLLTVAVLGALLAGVADAAVKKRNPKALTTEEAYRCKAANGRTYVSQVIPAECMDLDVEVLDETGRVVRVIPGRQSLEEIAQQKAAEEARKAAAQRDKTLLATYLTVADIERLRDQRIDLLEQQNVVTRQYIANLRAREARLMQSVQRFRPYSPKPNAPVLPEQIASEIVNTVKGLQVYEQELAKNTSERERLTREFGADIQRFKELKGIK